MLNRLFKKEVLDCVAEEAKEYAGILKDRWRMDLFATIIVFFIFVLPVSFMLSCFLAVEKTLFNIISGSIMLLAFGVGTIAFYRIFKKEIWNFKNGIAINLYYRHYLTKGKALTQEDLQEIKENNESLHYVITNLKAQGICYNVCFQILDTLEKGEIIFLRVICTQPEEFGPKYTMHVLYVKEGWCYDTFSEKQFLLDDYLKVSQGKIYKRYFYENLGGLTYEEFIKREKQMLKEWSDAHDCYTACIED